MTDATLGASDVGSHSELAETGWKRLAMHILVFVIIVGAWELAGVFNQLNDLLLPAPSVILGKFANMWLPKILGGTGTIYYHFAITLWEAVAGFFIGCAIGVSLAVAAAVFPVFRRYLAPYAVAFNVTPGIAVAPLIIAWFGFGISSKIALATLTCFFAPFINTLSGLLHVDEEAAELFRSMRANKQQYFWKLQLPSSMPLFIAGLKIALTGALLGAIVAEFFSASAGVGILMQRFAFKLDMGSALATLLSMSLMGLLFFTVMEILDYRVIFWKRDARMQAVSKRRKAAWKVN
jgi:NitT/TauT family transport system permease protein